MMNRFAFSSILVISLFYSTTWATRLEISQYPVALVSDTCPRYEFRHRRQTNAGAFAESLYETSDPILQLSSSNFDDEVFNKKKPPKAHLVEFYLSWCGHCRHFAPFYVKFAEDVKSWNSLVDVAAINCALDYNRDLCDANHVERVPYLRYFGRNAKEYDDALADLSAYRSVGQLRRQLTDLLVNEYEQNQYPDWPLLHVLPNASKTKEAWSEAPAEAKHLILVFERPQIDNYTSIETLLDFVPHYPRIVVRRVRHDHPLTEDWDIVDFPTLAITIRGNDVPIYISELRRMIVGDVLSKLALGPSYIEKLNGTAAHSQPLLHVPTTRAPASRETTTPETIESRRSKYYVSETDLLLAVNYALRTEVPFISKNIAGANFTNLTRFIDTLRRYFPKSRDVKDTLKFLKMPVGEELPRSDRARRFFADLYDYLASKNSTAANGSSISVDDWKAKLNELETQHNYPFPNDTNWQHCRGSKWKYRGYTCGLWSLFHTLTVNAYLEDGLKTGFDPFSVLYGVRGYVGTYFGCTYCAQHFMEMVTKTLKMEDWVKYSSDVVMYLWRAHNTVNKRLAGDSTEDPVFPKRQFPPDFLCDDCGKSKSIDEQPPEWIYRNVLRWMIRYYTSIRPHVEKGDNSTVTTTPINGLGNLTNLVF